MGPVFNNDISGNLLKIAISSLLAWGIYITVAVLKLPSRAEIREMNSGHSLYSMDKERIFDRINLSRERYDRLSGMMDRMRSEIDTLRIRQERISLTIDMMDRDLQIKKKRRIR